MKFTQKLSMHLNGGKTFSELQHNIFADGKATNLKRCVRTNGRPKYLKTMDVIWDATRPNDPTASFDVLATQGVGMQEWLETNVKVTEEAKSEDSNVNGT